MKKLKYKGKSKTIKQWAEHIGINESTIRSRLHAGKPIEEVLTNNIKVNQYE